MHMQVPTTFFSSVKCSIFCYFVQLLSRLNLENPGLRRLKLLELSILRYNQLIVYDFFQINMSNFIPTFSFKTP